MNIELLTKLANKAMSEPPYDGSADRWGMFAELIIQECVDIAYEYDAPKLSGPGACIAERIKDKFGFDLEEDE